MFDKLTEKNLVWFPEKEIGYFNVSDAEYDEKYFNKYELYSQTERGKEITKSRIRLVKKYYDGHVLDFGIGCGDFIVKHGNATGYDINKYAIAWLEKKGMYRCIYEGMHSVVTFWDSLEHVSDPDVAISHVKKMVFISIPIFKSENEILNSKHYRKNEHYWYFTLQGLTNWFNEQGFECIEQNMMEVSLGRSGIGTFVFRRDNA